MTLEAVTSVRVSVSPIRAFEIFTGDISVWWRRGTHFWNDPQRGVRYEFEPRLGGRLLEVYDDGVFEVGEITDWRPGELLQYTWRQADWTPEQVTTVTVRFSADGDGTLVQVTHGGWESLGQSARDTLGGYSAGWQQLLGFYSAQAGA
jgi:uncharacterized protein YndB with AHSA1/START domain